MSFALRRGPRDIKTAEDLSPSTDVESHHIFPKSLIKDHANTESVVNRLWILKKSNRDLGNRSPHDYLLSEIHSAKSRGLLEKVRERFASQFIPIEPFDLEDQAKSNLNDVFDMFLEERANMILTQLVEQLGRPFLQISKDAEEPDFNDDPSE